MTDPVTRVEAALRFAHELADIADAITLPAFATRLAHGGEVEQKSDGTPVTAVDRDVERALRRAIRSREPDHAMLGEEDGLDGPVDAPTWVVDPIDATANFVRGVPVFATLIALTVDGRGIAAVVTAPALGTRWDGIAGGPAHQDGREVRVSTVADVTDATISFGGLDYFDHPDVEHLTIATSRQRGFGDFWQHCLVASGAIDIAVEAEVSRWDLAAPKVIVEAAGGRLTSLTGADTDDAGSALSTNGHLHDAALALLRGLP